MERDNLTERIIGCAIEVHRELGPGLLESTYEQCLAREFSLQGIRYRLQSPQSVEYKGILIDCGYKLDVVVEDQVILELKSVAELAPIFDAQILTYMKLSSISTGLLINFNVKLLKDGLKRFKL